MALPNIPIPTAKAVSFVKEFRDFILKTNMLALALAVVLGGIIKAIRPTATGWDALNIPVWRFNFKMGPLLNALIEFACVAFVVFIVSKMFIKQAAPPPTKVCPECLELINPDASRCKYCTAAQPKAPPAVV